MKIFNKAEGFNDRVNFVDKNNVLVGFDMESYRCEDVGWEILDHIELNQIPQDEEIGNDDLEDYIFDPTFYISKNPTDPNSFNGYGRYTLYDEGGVIIFRLVAENKPPLFLHIWNAHNGYYSHGFDVEGINDITGGYL